MVKWLEMFGYGLAMVKKAADPIPSGTAKFCQSSSTWAAFFKSENFKVTSGSQATF